MKPEEILAAVAIIVSIITFGLTAFQAWRAEVIGMRPVLSVVYDPQRGWLLQNVGNGPAMNVTVAQRPAEGDWEEPVRLPPISGANELVLFWLEDTNVHAIGATYADFKEHPYTSVCRNDLTTTEWGHNFGPWPEHKIKRYWQLVANRRPTSV